MKILILILLTLLSISQEKVIVLGAPAADIIKELSVDEKIIGSDNYSQKTFFKNSKNIGFLDSITPKNINELGQDYIIYIENGLSIEAIKFLKNTTIPVYRFQSDLDKQTVLDNIFEIGKIFKKELKANDLLEKAQMKLVELEFKMKRRLSLLKNHSKN